MLRRVYSFMFTAGFLRFIYLVIIIILTVVGLCCCLWACSSCGKQGLLSIAMCGLLGAVASLAAEHRL